VILADEPVASLDPELAHEVMGFLRKAATEQGIPVLINIHDVELAKEYTDRMFGIADGRVEFDGTPVQLTPAIQRAIYRRDPRSIVGAGEAHEHAGHALPAFQKEATFGDAVK
jgi:phosphonate transport system ATP-binding protein